MALKGNQKKLDKNNNNRIDAQDFKILKAEKAKGRGMGLQDEKVKPGKVMKAKRGTGILSEKGKSKTFSGYSKPFKGPQHGGRVATIVGVKPGAKIKGQKKKFKSMEEMRKAKGFKPGESAKDFNKRRMALATAKEAAKATRIGKIVLPIAAAGVAAQQYLKSKMKKKDKKMGGGMMKKYSSGGPVPVERIRKAFPEASPGKVARMQTMLGDKTAPMKKERLFEGDRVRRKELIKKLKGVAKTTPMGLGIKAAETAKKLKEKMSKKMGGGMMKRPMGYVSGGLPGPTQGKERLKDRTRRPNTGRAARRAVARKERVMPIISSSETHSRQKDGSMKKTEYRYSADDGKAQTYTVRSGKAVKYDNAPFKTIDSRTYGLRVGGSVTAKCKLGRNKPTKMY
jgi:hypothetical protein